VNAIKDESPRTAALHTAPPWEPRPPVSRTLQNAKVLLLVVALVIAGVWFAKTFATDVNRVKTESRCRIVPTIVTDRLTGERSASQELQCPCIPGTLAPLCPAD
jgi:hypothetical protein